MLRVLIRHPLFSLTPLAQKKLLRIAKLLSKKETPRTFRACGRDEGAALDLRAFEKARAKLS